MTMQHWTGVFIWVVRPLARLCGGGPDDWIMMVVLSIYLFHLCLLYCAYDNMFIKKKMKGWSGLVGIQKEVLINKPSDARKQI
jgi:hypothetical protein